MEDTLNTEVVGFWGSNYMCAIIVQTGACFPVGVMQSGYVYLEKSTVKEISKINMKPCNNFTTVEAAY